MKKSYKENELRNRKAICCLTDGEYRDIKKDIAKLGLTMSEYLRRILFDKRAHLVVDSAQLVNWLDKVAIESHSSIISIQRFANQQFTAELETCQIEELNGLVKKCITSHDSVGRCMRKLIKVIENN